MGLIFGLSSRSAHVQQHWQGRLIVGLGGLCETKTVDIRNPFCRG
jgi:hypothetical protein